MLSDGTTAGGVEPKKLLNSLLTARLLAEVMLVPSHARPFAPSSHILAVSILSNKGLTSHSKKRLNIGPDYAEYVDKWNIRLISDYPADTSLQIYPEIRLAKNGNNIWK